MLFKRSLCPASKLRANTLMLLSKPTLSTKNFAFTYYY